MTTATQYSSYFHVERPAQGPSILRLVIDTLFMVRLRESLAAATSSEQSEGAYIQGL
jgi:hypothetical protein